MFMSKGMNAFVAAVIAITLAGVSSPYGLGDGIKEADLAAWNIDVSPDGAGLPAGHGNVASGEKIFMEKCSACHGSGTKVPLWGRGPLTKEVTIGNYWPFATTIFDYVRRAMPQPAPQSLSADETYAVTAYLLWKNGIVAHSATMDRHSLPLVIMPNRNGFIWVDPRPDAP